MSCAATSAAMSADLPFVYLNGELVAVAGRTRCHFVSYDLDPATLRFIAAMCLCKREVDEGRLAGPFTSELAERWARLVLIRPHLHVAEGSDGELAARLGVPPDQVALARAEMGEVRVSRPRSRGSSRAPALRPS